MNLERWPIFAVRSSKGERTISRKTATGTQVVKIGCVVREGKTYSLTAQDGKVYYGLCVLWKEAGKPKQPVQFTLRKLADVLHIDWGSKAIRELKRSLFNLQGVPIVFENCYRLSKHDKAIETVSFNILDSIYIFERCKRKDEKQPYLAFSSFKFNDYIIQSLQNNYFKPLRLDVIKQLKSDVAFILYRYLDLIMADKTHFEQDLDTIIDFCVLSRKQPHWKLKQTIQKAIKQLEGKEITTGVLRNLRIEPSQTESGWKLVVDKVRREVVESEAVKEVSDAEKLVIRFHEALYHAQPDGSPVKPTELELTQAQRLIDTYGVKGANKFLSFALDIIEERNLKPEMFGYVLTFENRYKELMEQERKEKEMERRKREQEKKEREEFERQRKEEEFWLNEFNLLPKIQQEQVRQMIHDKVKAERNGGTVWNLDIELRIPDFMKTLPKVKLVFHQPAEDVKIAGDWNNWEPEPMVKGPDGWTKEFYLLPGVYKYKFIADGKWVSDPESPKANDEFDNNIIEVHIKEDERVTSQPISM